MAKEDWKGETVPYGHIAVFWELQRKGYVSMKDVKELGGPDDFNLDACMEEWRRRIEEAGGSIRIYRRKEDEPVYDLFCFNEPIAMAAKLDHLESLQELRWLENIGG